jgi:hypothetical protein
VKTYESKIVEFEGQICIVFSDEMCRDANIKVGDPVDVSYDEKERRIVIQLKDK